MNLNLHVDPFRAAACAAAKRSSILLFMLIYRDCHEVENVAIVNNGGRMAEPFRRSRWYRYT